jgi:NADP-reducing hydrogenase subunit HndD
MGVTLTINGQKITVEPGISVLEAARASGIDIPTLCYDPNLPKPGACRLCVVEIKGMRNLPASCVTTVSEGMEVETESQAVQEARKTIVDLLLANHPTDCLTCEKSGECKLQDYAYRYGVRETSFEGDRKEYPIDDTNPYIYRDQNKCILCGKCVRTCAEVTDRQVIDFAYRGFNTKVVPALDTDLKDSDCVYCNRCVSICPVGALVDRRMMGKGRNWELVKKEITCTFCEAGCQFDVNYQENEIVGVTAKNPSTGRPLCLKGRLGLEFIYNPNCTEEPLIKRDGEFVKVSWEEALGIGPIIAKLTQLKAEGGKSCE